MYLLPIVPSIAIKPPINPSCTGVLSPYMK
jgi:hypothetical protein